MFFLGTRRVVTSEGKDQLKSKKIISLIGDIVSVECVRDQKIYLGKDVQMRHKVVNPYPQGTLKQTDTLSTKDKVQTRGV